MPAEVFAVEFGIVDGHIFHFPEGILRCNLCTFEYSTLQADIHGAITNIKNPMSGCIVADEFGSITIDENIKAPADCEIRLRDERTCFTD